MDGLNHTGWDCKYHLVFIPKCRRNYALATHKPAVSQLHSSVGPGNALGSLYHTPKAAFASRRHRRRGGRCL